MLTIFLKNYMTFGYDPKLKNTYRPLAIGQSFLACKPTDRLAIVPSRQRGCGKTLPPMNQFTTEQFPLICVNVCEYH